MGKLTYDSTLTVDFDDRVLAHLQIVIAAKLRRGESFQLTWRDDPAVGGGRTTIWLSPTLPLSFRYHTARLGGINPAWIDALMRAANSSGGLQVVPEPVEIPEAPPEVARRAPRGHRFTEATERSSASQPA